MELTAVALHDADAFGLEQTAQHVDRVLRIARRTAGEDVYRGVTMLWPGMDDQVAFRNDGDSRHADRTERVHPQVQQIDVQGHDHLTQGAFSGFDRVQILTAPHLEDDLATNVCHRFTSTTTQPLHLPSPFLHP